MIDLHCHILPGVDDGANSEEESLMMAQLAADNGVTAIAMTPHCNVPNQFDNYADRKLLSKLIHMRTVFKEHNIPIKFYPGMEVYVTPELPELIDEERVLTLGMTKYLLVEFGFDEPAVFMRSMLKAVTNRGLIPVIAHPERYYCAQDDPGIMMEWCDRGYALQINKGSLFGMFGRRASRAAHWCLGEGCIHLIGSDAHSPFVRTPKLAEAWDYISDFASPDIANFLLDENPQAILDDKDIRPVLAEF